MLEHHILILFNLNVIGYYFMFTDIILVKCNGFTFKDGLNALQCVMNAKI